MFEEIWDIFRELFVGWSLAKIVGEEVSMQGQGWDKVNLGQSRGEPSEPPWKGSKPCGCGMEDRIFGKHGGLLSLL